MPAAILVLAGFQLVGELLREAFVLPVPGPVIGMFLLAAALGARARLGRKSPTPPPLKTAAEALIANMGLLFVPAGVGVIAEYGLVRQQWLPILLAVVGSTILSIVVTGLVMQWITHLTQKGQHHPSPTAGARSTVS